jgi:hypothetical protein
MGGVSAAFSAKRERGENGGEDITDRWGRPVSEKEEGESGAGLFQVLLGLLPGFGPRERPSWAGSSFFFLLLFFSDF